MNPTYVPDGKASALEIRGEEVTAIYADRREPINVPTRVRPSQAGVIGNRRSGSR
jgi:hypothetical protein